MRNRLLVALALTPTPVTELARYAGCRSVHQCCTLLARLSRDIGVRLSPSKIDGQPHVHVSPEYWDAVSAAAAVAADQLGDDEIERCET